MGIAVILWMGAECRARWPTRVPSRQSNESLSRTRTPLVVGLVAVAVVGLLVWRPWAEPSPDSPAEPAGRCPDRRAAADPSLATTATPPISSGPPAHLRPSSRLRRCRRPTWRHSVRPASSALGDADANVRCQYGPRTNGQRFLQSLEVLPPLAYVTNPRDEVSHLESMGWRAELQMNRLDTLFDSEWETVARSRRQLARAINDQPANFKPLTLALNAQQTPPSAVFRVLVVVEWYTRNVELAGRGELIASRYAQGDSPTFGPRAATPSGASPRRYYMRPSIISA